MVRRAVDGGALKQTELDKFDARDNTIGPRVHTAVFQIVKPVTAKAGNMSWALMMHPEGLHCDVFVTHGWHEGILEFIDKVINSWPPGAMGAYCCMFANPQNLDIGALVSSPRDSPFALALSGARFVMVVPNTQVSIYSRIWCTYEAFLAYEKSKLIFTAVTPTPSHAWLRALRDFAIHLALCGVSTCAFLTLRGSGEELDWDSASIYEILGLSRMSRVLFIVVIVTNAVVIFIAQTAKPYSTRQRMLMLLSSLLGSIPAGFWFRAFLFTVTDEAYFDTKHRAAYYRAQMLAHAVFIQGYGAATAVLEVDNVWSDIRDHENRALQRGYSGRLKDAQSSVPADKENICAELSSSGCEEAANQAVRVLIENGMSTPRLRRVVELAGELRTAGYWNLALAVGVPIWTVTSLRYITARIALHTNYTMYRLLKTGHCECLIGGAGCVEAGTCEQDSDTCSPSGFNSPCWHPLGNPFFLMTTVNLLMGVAWIWVFVRMHPDLRRFAAISTTRLQMFGYAVGTMLDTRFGDSMVESNHSATVRFFASLVIYAVLALGPARLAMLPAMGPPMVRFFFANLRSNSKHGADPPEKGGGAAPASERAEEILPI